MNTLTTRLVLAAVTALVGGVARPASTQTQTAPACVHDRATETPAQQARREHALGLARTINSGESTAAARNGSGSYATLGELVAFNYLKPQPAGGYVPGFTVRLDASDKVYWFSVTDTTDPCGFRYISNQDGLIFSAQPIQ